MVERLLASGRQGIYFKVITEGEIAAGDPIEVIDRAEDSVPLEEVTRLYAHDKEDLPGLRRIIGIAALPDDWRTYFEKRITRMSAREATQC
jgi:MOSC domain-containing protein YiiM